jgi:hypothetical protein
MKAIHNTNIYPEQSIITVFNISKIQNESNSQQYVESAVTEADCVQYFKDTK